jgi:hypothetical protein
MTSFPSPSPHFSRTASDARARRPRRAPGARARRSVPSATAVTRLRLKQVDQALAAWRARAGDRGAPCPALKPDSLRELRAALVAELNPSLVA